VELEAYRNIAGGGIEQLKELNFGVFESLVRHVVDKRNSDAIRRRGGAVDRARRR
jgi:hypothetical protein